MTDSKVTQKCFGKKESKNAVLREGRVKIERGMGKSPDTGDARRRRQCWRGCRRLPYNGGVERQTGLHEKVDVLYLTAEAWIDSAAWWLTGVGSTFSRCWGGVRGAANKCGPGSDGRWERAIDRS